MNLIKSEWRKLVYVRAHWGLLLVSILISALSTASTPIVLDSSGEMFGFGLEQQQAVDSVYANAISSYIFAVILGIMLMAGEYRHGTAVATFLAAPRRGQVVASKLIVAAIAGSVLMVVSTAAALGAGWFALRFYPDAATRSEGIFTNTMVAALISGLVLGVIGIAIGTLVRNQLLAIVMTLIYLFIIDPILLALWPDAGKWLPSGLMTAMLALDIEAPELGFDTSLYLPPLTATLVLLGFGVVFAAVAVATSLRRDVE